MPQPNKELKPLKEIDLGHAMLLEGLETLDVQVGLVFILLHCIDLTTLSL